MPRSAQAYYNEAGVGDALAESGLPREEFFLTTKVWITNAGYEKARASIEESMRKLRTDYLDLLLIHQPFGDYYGTYRAMEELYKAGRLRAIGVSNFGPDRYLDIQHFAEIKPAVNQIEIHPYMTQQEVVGNTFAKGIQVEGCAPLGQGGAVLQDGTIGAIARKHGKSIAQVILRWNIQRGLIAIPRCDNADYTAENMDIFDFELSPVEMSVINGLNRNERTYEKNDPDNFPW